jgi:homoserine/homoserine lactone efflux protein
MTVEAWALFCLTELLLCLNPGPSALLVVSLALARSRGAGLIASLGVLAANAVYFSLSASGLLAVHAASAPVFVAVRWIGAGYLVWLGVRMLARSFRERDAPPPPSRGGGGRGAFWQGFLVQAANPNLLVYFTAILPQFVDPTQRLAGQVAILAGSSFVIELAVLSAYAALAFQAGSRGAAGLRPWFERLGGGLLMAAGAGVASLARE